MEDMEHHLEFLAPVPLLRGRNRLSRRGCRWNLTGIIVPRRAAKSSIFNRFPERWQMNREGELLNGTSELLDGNYATRRLRGSSKS
jgi:hypothetical protein